MWRLLILAGAGIGAYALYRHMSDQDSGEKGEAEQPETPETPPLPPDVINLSAETANSFYGNPAGSDIVWVTALAMNRQRPEQTVAVVQSFTSLQAARAYQQTLREFFDKHGAVWTCPDGTGLVEVKIFGFVGNDPEMQTLQHQRWGSCPLGQVQMSGGVPPIPTGGASKPVYIVGYQIRSGIQDSQTFMFGSNEEAERWYETLQEFFTQPAIRSAYTWPTGHVTVQKYGTPPAAARFTMVDENGVIVRS